jgi:L-ascorbate metabolism protein UlaG (beta-lactamase superfamily)
MTASRTDSIATDQGALEITAIHHASLMLAWNGKHILVDPAPLKNRGVEVFAPLPKPDAILYTHDHFDHYDTAVLNAVLGPDTEIVAPQDVVNAMPEALRGRVKLLKNGDTATVAGIPLAVMPMYNTSPQALQFHPKGRGNGYILTFGNKRIYIAGDSEEAPELKSLPGIDAAFLAMNQPYTLKVADAAHWVKDFKPAAVYPYHYRNADGSFSKLDAFKTAVAGLTDVRLLDWY